MISKKLTPRNLKFQLYLVQNAEYYGLTMEQIIPCIKSFDKIKNIYNVQDADIIQALSDLNMSLSDIMDYIAKPKGTAPLKNEIMVCEEAFTRHYNKSNRSEIYSLYLKEMSFINLVVKELHEYFFKQKFSQLYEAFKVVRYKYKEALPSTITLDRPIDKIVRELPIGYHRLSIRELWDILNSDGQYINETVVKSDFTFYAETVYLKITNTFSLELKYEDFITKNIEEIINSQVVWVDNRCYPLTDNTELLNHPQLLKFIKIMRELK